MKTLLGIGSILLLCSCAATPVMNGSIQSSFNGTTYTSGPTNANDPRLRSPQFYMNDDKSPVLQPTVPARSQFSSADDLCVANCQAGHYAAAYCNQACSR